MFSSKVVQWKPKLIMQDFTITLFIADSHGSLHLVNISGECVDCTVMDNSFSPALIE